ncbi:hypothetical protein RHS01_10686 [Rhizoctonia solani]|uniref:Retrotransposon gag domain-containing protein n=1 Tax=Rhizoctonia solani TaxID=456999 RepID=A0A8H7I3G1_9AGAM|nr:hypothetical protein RHS01_10686 [Rhizoctonia solani]
MATRPRTSSRAQSPFNPRDLGPRLPSATPIKLGEVSLERVTRLLLGLLSQVENLERKLEEVKETGIETRTNVENISQTVDVVKDGLQTLQLHGPRTPEEAKPPVVEATPRPLHKIEPIGSVSGPSFWPEQPKGLPGFAQPAPQRAIPPRVSSPPPSPRLRSPIGVPAPPAPAPAVTYPARAAERKITTLTQSGTCADYITKFRTLAMELDWNDAALRGQFARGLHWEVSRQIATREHRPQTLLELQNAALVIDNALREERASHPPRDNKSSRPSNPARERVPVNQAPVRRNSLTTPTLCRKKRGIAAAPLAPASNAAKWATSSRNAARAGRLPLWRTRGKPKKPPKLAKSLDPNREKTKVTIKSPPCSQFRLNQRSKRTLRSPDRFRRHLIISPPAYRRGITPTPHRPPHSTYCHYAQWVEPQAGKIWKKAVLTFSFDGKRMTETFLICNTGSHAAILGLKWLDAHNPEIDWNSRTLSFPHTPPEHVSIAEEEEADKNPLEGVPPEYHQYAKVFGEEEFNKLPPHWHYDIGIELTEEGPLNSPLYSMTDAESATLRDWLKDELKAGKIRPVNLLSALP